MVRAFLLLLILLPVGCIEVPRTVTVTLAVGKGRQSATALGHPYYLLTVSGPGIPTEYPDSPTASCLGLGANSVLVNKDQFIAGSLSVQVRAGKDRRVRLLGFDYDGYNPTSLAIALQFPPPRVHVLGEATLDLLSNSTVTLTNVYEPSTSENLLSGCLVPTLQSVAPATGGSHGGQLLTLTGSNFLDSTQVLIGGTECVAKKRLSSTEIRCFSPPHSTGAKTIEVINPGPKPADVSLSFNYVADLAFNSFSHVQVSSPSAAFGPMDLINLGGQLVGTFLDGTDARIFFKESGHTYQTLSTSASASATLATLTEHEGALYSGHGGASADIGRRIETGAVAITDAFTPVGGGLPALDPGGLDVIGGGDKLVMALVDDTADHIQIFKRDADNDWSRADDDESVNLANGNPAKEPHLVYFENKLHVAWVENNGTRDVVRVARNNGSVDSPNWERIVRDDANGLSLFAGSDAQSPFLIVFNEKLYVFWEETFSGPIEAKLLAAVWLGGTDWFPVNSPSSPSGTEQAKNPRAVVAGERLYVTWSETNGTDTRIHLSVYGGDDQNPSWPRIDAGGVGLNVDLDDVGTEKNGSFPNLIEVAGSLYVIFREQGSTTENIQSARAVLP